MKLVLSPWLCTLFVASNPVLEGAGPLDYPDSRRTDFSETIHGVKVADPYRWLEASDSEEVKAWVKEQAAFGEAFLNALPGRELLKERLTTLWDYERHGLPHQKAGRLFYSRNSGLQNQSVLYWKADEKGAEERLLLDPNRLSEDGTVALSDYEVSENGRYLAYGVSVSGSDWQEWHVRDISTGEDLPDRLTDIKFSSVGWSRDSTGFLYSRYPSPGEDEDRMKMANIHQKVYYHALGEPQGADVLVYERPDEPKWGFNAFYSEDGEYQLLKVRTAAGGDSGLFYRSATNPEADFVELIPPVGSKNTWIDCEGTMFYVVTDYQAPNGRLVAIDLEHPEPDLWKDMISERKETLRSVAAVGDVFVAQYLKDVLPEVVVTDRLGRELKKIEMPEIGSASGFDGRRSDSTTFYMLSGFANPGRIFRYDLESERSELFWEAKVEFEPDDFTTEQVFYTSRDGTRVPMFLVYKKSFRRGEPAPTFLYGYGGFDISLAPAFQVSNLVWLEQGGVFALANLRGGGEYGQSWHDAGMRANKQNVFDDFVAAAEWLCENGVTLPKKLAIGGGSNGGLLTAACLNQRPDLFGAVFTAVGVHDMLRFPYFTIGWAWQDEYGYVEREADFRNLLSYSPYHNVNPGTQYPAVLITTADHDDRVYPAHSFKYGAAMQYAQRGEAPIVLRIETKAGHGAGKPTAKVIEEVADRWAFLAAALKMQLSVQE